VSNPLIRAFFVGRATADLLAERLEDVVTDVLSEIGKFESEQRENLKEFTEQVLTRANEEEARVMDDLGHSGGGGSSYSRPANDVQATVDGIRAEVAQLRSALQQHRNADN
jgi:hypothetical protein